MKVCRVCGAMVSGFGPVVPPLCRCGSYIVIFDPAAPFREGMGAGAMVWGGCRISDFFAVWEGFRIFVLERLPAAP